jgi:HEAT repeats
VVAGGAVTAQELYRQMLSELITPALRQMGMRGTRGSYRYTVGDYTGVMATQKSRYSSKQKVDFTVNLVAGYDPTMKGYWDSRLDSLMPGRRTSWWTVETGHPTGPVAADLLTAFRGYGWPALLAALDSPGYPPDPAARRARTFPRETGPVIRRDMPPPRALLGGDQEIDGILRTDIRDPDPAVRVAAAEILRDRAPGDPRAQAAFLTSLATDPDARVRQLAAAGLTPWAAEEKVRRELRVAAAEDEDLCVRWAARYAIRRAPRPGPGISPGQE